jgi:hypothetical protein
MTAKKAYDIVTTKHSGMRVASCYEYDSMFVFQLAPEMSKNTSGLLTGLTCVYKKTGVVKAFRPTYISLDEYHRGKEVPASAYGGE